MARKHTVSLYCPRCNDIYAPKSSRHANIDGAYFGTTFPHLFLMTYPQAVPLPPTSVFMPRVFGFRIRRGAAAGGAGAASGGGELADAGAGAEAASAGSSAALVRSIGPAGAPVVARREAAPGAGGGAPRRELATVLPRDASGRPIGRDGRAVLGGDDFLDEADAAQTIAANASAHSNAMPGSAVATAAVAAAAAAAAKASVVAVGAPAGEAAADGKRGDTYAHVRVEQLAEGAGEGGGAESLARSMQRAKI